MEYSKLLDVGYVERVMFADILPFLKGRKISMENIERLMAYLRISKKKYTCGTSYVFIKAGNFGNHVLDKIKQRYLERKFYGL